MEKYSVFLPSPKIPETFRNDSFLLEKLFQTLPGVHAVKKPFTPTRDALRETFQLAVKINP